MPALGLALLQALWAGWVLALQPPPPTAFTPNGTHLQHLARDPTSGTLYLGATNFLFQLSPELQLEATVSTGPVLDSRDCLPPVMPDECPQAQPTSNLNQLLLVSPGALVVCGSVHQGVCEQRRLGQLGQLLLRPERPGDTQYVAANDPTVSTVGLVAQGPSGEPLLFVGRGYTSRGVGGGIPPITTRALQPPDPQAAFSYEETAKLAVGRLSEYSHHFVSAFARGASAYFLFLRRDLQAQSRAFRAYVSRVCLRDQHYYSYVELPLACHGGRYGLIQAAAVAASAEVAQGEVLFVAFSSAAPPTVGRPPSAAAGMTGASALCAFPLDEVDRLANRTRDACYTREGRAEDGAEVAYIEYDVNSDCAQLPVDTLDAYPCGSDHTPSPMASRVALEATPVLEWPGVQLTAVAITVEDGHTIAFLGDSQGQLHRAYLGPGSDGHPYSTQIVQQGSAVSRDLIFDGAFKHLYVMTQSTLLKVPVASCAQHLDCVSCLAHRDPYCGWCVLLGRCSRRSECSRGRGSERWLWSFHPELGCLRVAALSPANISREERREVFLSVPDLPPLWPGESYSCHFGESQSPALLTNSGVMCPSPDPSEAPELPRGADHVSVSMELRFGAVMIAEAALSFYDCVAVTLLRPSAPCQACVSSHWGCNWCVWQHLCTHKASCDAGPMVVGRQSPLLSPAPPARDAPTSFPPTAPQAMVTPTPDTLPVDTPSVASDVPPGARPSPFSPWGPWAGTGPTPASAPTELPLPGDPPPAPSSPQSTPGPTVLTPSALGPLATPEDQPASHPLPSEAAALAPAPVEPGPEAPPLAGPRDHPPGSSPATTFPGAAGSTKPALDWLMREGGELPEADEWTGGDTPALSTSSLLSGDGDSAEHEGPPAPLILLSSLDYQYDTPGLGELEEVTWGAASCPCVESVQGSSLMPVHVRREVRLLGRNLRLFQDSPGDHECVMELEGREVVVEARVECEPPPDTRCHVTCRPHQLSYEALQPELRVGLFLRWAGRLRVDSVDGLHVVLYDCSVGHEDCSRCQTALPQYGCVWCKGERPQCMAREACGEAEAVVTQCPAPVIHSVEPLTGPVDGGTRVTIRGSNLGQHVQDVQDTVRVAGVPCAVDAQDYEVSSSLVCITGASREEVAGAVTVEVPGRGRGVSEHDFAYQDPKVQSVFPARGPRAGGTSLTLHGSKLLTGRLEDIRVVVGDQPCHLLLEQQAEQLQCETSPHPTPATLPVAVWFGAAERRLQHSQFEYTSDPNVTSASPTKSFLSGGREIRVCGQNLDVVQTPRIRVTVATSASRLGQGLERRRRVVPETACSPGMSCGGLHFEEPCHVNSSQLITCRTPALPGLPEDPWVRVEFILDNLVFDFATLNPTPFSYEPDPTLQPLNPEDPSAPFRHKPGSVLSVEGENLDLAMSKEEVVALIGDGPCVVKTLTRHHLYCEPPMEQPLPRHHALREAPDALPEFTVQMGNLRFSLGHVQYDGESPVAFPLAAQVGLGVGTSLLALGVIIIVLMYRRKSKQALRDYKKVQIQLENLESSVRDRCKKEFTDLMTEMTDLTSDLLGSGIPFLDYKVYAERVFFPGHQESPLHRDLGVPESRRPTVEQGLGQLSNLLNSKLFLTKFIHTLESQRTFSARDRAYVASLLTVALHGKLEYFTDILRTLLSDLVAQYVAKNPKLMLRRTETVVEKLLTNWMSICLYTFVRDAVGEPLYMLFRGIKHQVDKGPVDSVTGKAKYTLNDNRLLREDVEYRPLTLNALLAVGHGAGEAQGVPVKVLDCDTISQAKEKMLDQLYKGVPLAQRPDPRTLDVEWRSGVAGHLILSDEDVTSEIQGLWRRLNTLQHYKVPDGATVALVPCLTKHVLRESQDYVPGESLGTGTPMLEDVDEGGIRPWHLVKPSEEPEPPRPRRGSLRGGERERAKAIPEIYLTRLLSMKGTLQKFVDDLFQVILSTSRPVPLAIKYFFDLLDEQAQQHGISDQDTVHIWKTNSLPLRFWINIIKNPQFVFDVQTSDNMDAVLLVIAQTFMDACTLADHKLGRDSPINKLLYARDIPRYKRMVERYYADIRQTIPASDQEMNSILAELSRNYSGDLGARVALHELYKYINKYYDQIITALEEDGTAQKMQLGYRLQQIAAAVENKVTDL
ncbi:plexin-B1 isoform X1 [Ovis aries]|uniref:Plexin B1 n=1 Tax=Ovis aries TaxID=9940 RepID=A0AC11CK40_SHEEP|nr:plexin-B1 isoform X1 [Ovis aries]XP_042092203.1 plexin-B1 isoform X1 [Ovis aries]XP_042092204.1 plexin-B1 isoform X1 [Ovis aries]XP_042092205.1 plexin-B1 isoform X1 [Ovis aries]XP_042092206.1 plexin-B1 isoform X1 [Ovis aries]XP_042092207.1 plexin-B1 isoform X1 [Ovis aries]XP_042092208.1 plexin-B1 isoform X1 [Ovis aries]XP_060258883.1 plexin-B1 isoform X1 [Ovis aries]XP_060258884.1 plexin-B1 isoform X1 [Ovis aries]